MPADDEGPDPQPTVNVISFELAQQRAADRDERLRRRFRRPFDRPALGRPVATRRRDMQ
jgi:hypothetical protein